MKLNQLLNANHSWPTQSCSLWILCMHVLLRSVDLEVLFLQLAILETNNSIGRGNWLNRILVD